jgi:ornithine cyclodeaminase
MATTIDRASILDVLWKASANDLINCIEKSFVSYSNGAAVVPPVGTLAFQQPPGETHIKYGYLKGEPYYVIKIASGFYENPSLGLPSSNGLNLVFSQKTGTLECVLLDEGYLTDLRTALAGAVIAKHFSPESVSRIGIVGTGIQARLQLEYLQHVTDCREVAVMGRSAEKTKQYCADMKAHGFDVKPAKDASELAADCNLIVTTTPAKSPVMTECRLRPGTLVTAMGADTVGKQELHESILQQADLIVLDSRSQCEHHGEIHKAFQNGLLADSKMEEVGELIASGYRRGGSEDIIVADLTGIATQDILISQFVLSHI